MEKWEKLPAGTDAVFLSDSSFVNQVCIIYINECANDGNGSIEIEYVTNYEIKELYEEVEGNVEKFFDLLPDTGRCYYCDNTPEWKKEFDAWIDDFPKADFIVGRDGGQEEELACLLEWANRY